MTAPMLVTVVQQNADISITFLSFRGLKLICFQCNNWEHAQYTPHYFTIKTTESGFFTYFNWRITEMFAKYDPNIFQCSLFILDD